MREELNKKISDDFPLIFSRTVRGTVRNTAYPFPFAVGDGWYDILYRLFEILNREAETYRQNTNICFCGHLEKEHADKCSAVIGFREEQAPCKCQVFQASFPYVVDVKEKFGGLRVSCSGLTNVMSNAIEAAQRECWTTCDVCGAAGSRRNNDYIEVLCDDHYQPDPPNEP